MTQFQSSSDFKSDILAVLELNEASYIAVDDDKSESKEGYFTIACEIRARLLQALNKATHFFENNLELLATIAQLKREAAAQMQDHKHGEEILNGRVSSLMEVVRQQQSKIDAQTRQLTLKGIWTNLLASSHNPPTDQMEDDCARVITWISLQCAHDASRSIEQHADDAASGDGARLSLSSVLDYIRDVYSRNEDTHLQVCRENTELRKRLQETAANREAEGKVCAERGEECTALRGEVENLTVRVRTLEDACQRLNHVADGLEEKVQRQRVEIAEHRETAKCWRAKCLETLDALDVATAALSASADGESAARDIPASVGNVSGTGTSDSPNGHLTPGRSRSQSSSSSARKRTTGVLWHTPTLPSSPRQRQTDAHSHLMCHVPTTLDDPPFTTSSHRGAAAIERGRNIGSGGGAQNDTQRSAEITQTDHFQLPPPGLAQTPDKERPPHSAGASTSRHRYTPHSAAKSNRYPSPCGARTKPPTPTPSAVKEEARQVDTDRESSPRPIPATPTVSSVGRKYEPVSGGGKGRRTPSDAKGSDMRQGRGWNSYFAYSSGKKSMSKEAMSAFDSEHSNRVLADALSLREQTRECTGTSQKKEKEEQQRPISPIARLPLEAGGLAGSASELPVVPPELAYDLLRHMESPLSGQHDTGNVVGTGAMGNSDGTIQAGEKEWRSKQRQAEKIVRQHRRADDDVESQFSFDTTVAESLEIF